MQMSSEVDVRQHHLPSLFLKGQICVLNDPFHHACK